MSEDSLRRREQDDGGREEDIFAAAHRLENTLLTQLGEVSATLTAKRNANESPRKLPALALEPVLRREYTGHVLSMTREPAQGPVAATLWVDEEGAWDGLAVTLTGNMGGPECMPQKLASAFERRRVRLVIEVYSEDIERQPVPTR
jgi:hypothetical protein